jgi:hypothetical protein
MEEAFLASAELLKTEPMQEVSVRAERRIKGAEKC